MVSIGYAGHITPLFELAKALKNHHNITFITQPLGQNYVDFKSFSNSSFHLIYTNDSSEALQAEKQKEQQLIAYSANHSFFDSMVYTTHLLSEDSASLLIKTVHILMDNQFDVIIVNSLIKSVHILCQQTNTPCVIQSTESIPNMLDFNLPNIYSLLPPKKMTQIKYRLYNVIYTLRLMGILVTKLLPSMGTVMKTLPKIPGPFYDSFSMTNLLTIQAKCLELISIPSTFYPPSYSHHYTKYLGAFIDESSIKYEQNELTKWIEPKSNNSIIYGAFGTSSLIQFHRMKALVYGLAEFLLNNPYSHLLLALRHHNHDTYQRVINEMKNEKYARILLNNERVRVANGFVPQKWILQQNSIKLFLSHCGMGSCSEGIYFQKPILCLPFNMDQFVNAMAIEHTGIGLSLFIPPSLFGSLIKPYHFYDYTFSSESVSNKLKEIWDNENYQTEIRIMSLEMKHAGGLKQAVKEIEFFIQLKGDLDRYAPFQSTLPFYQRYMLDLLCIFVIFPLIFIIFLVMKCRKRYRKEKKE